MEQYYKMYHVTIDKSLAFNNHISNVINKCQWYDLMLARL